MTPAPELIAEYQKLVIAYGNACAAKNFTIAQIVKIFWGKIQLRAYVEDFDHARGRNGKPSIQQLFDRFNQTLLRP